MPVSNKKSRKASSQRIGGSKKFAKIVEKAIFVPNFDETDSETEELNIITGTHVHIDLSLESEENDIDNENENEVNVLTALNSVNDIKWNTNAPTDIKDVVYSGDSRTTVWRNKQTQKKIDRLPKIISMFVAAVVEPEMPENNAIFEINSDNESSKSKKHICYQPDKLFELLELLRPYSMIAENSVKQRKLVKENELFDLMKFQCIQQYYYDLLYSPRSKVASSVNIAKRQWISHYNKKSLLSPEDLEKKSQYRASLIRHWAKEFYLHSTITASNRGKHSKSISLLTHEDVRAALLIHLRSQRADAITVPNFCNATSRILLEMGYGGEICESTARRWLLRLGFFRWSYKQGIYYDGHERPDVVAYRKRFVKTMATLRKRMIEYSGPLMDVQLQPDPEHGQELVLVVHDECCFNSHEGISTVWCEKTVLRPKGRGRSYMVSEFLCQCHGHMVLNDEQALQLPLGRTVRTARQTLLPGVNAEGYWCGEHVVAQLEDVIPIFEILHPGKKAFFMFDNSSNHNVYAPDALKVTDKTINVSDGGVKLLKSKMRDGMFNGVPQPMKDATGKQFGLERILTHRGLWKAGMLKADALALLQDQPDFKAQQPWIKETVMGAHHDVIFLPKFHPEFNWIERYWGAAKKYTRRNCNYTWEGLLQAVPLALESVSLCSMRKFAQKSFRYIDAYDELADGAYMSPEQAEYSVKRYKSHRSVREYITDLDLQMVKQDSVDVPV